MDFLREKPFRSWLETRETIIPRAKLITGLSKRAVPQIDLPAGVSRKEAVEAVAGTSWARGIAQGIADKGGLSGVPREAFIDNFSHQVAEGIIASSYLPEALRVGKPGRPRMETYEESKTQPRKVIGRPKGPVPEGFPKKGE